MFLRVSIQAFYKTEATAEALRRLQGDRRLLRAEIDIQPGGIQNAASVLSNTKSADFLFVETEETGPEFLALLDSLAEVCDPDTKVVLLGVQNDIHLYRQLLDMGIQEYLPCPVETEELLEIMDRLTSTEAPARSRVLAFVGARGGVGSSSIAVNTAFCLSQKFSEDVVLLDLDFAFGTAALSLNMLPNQNIAEAFLQSNRLDEVMLERFLTHYDERLSIIAAPAQLDASFQLDLDAFESLMGILGRRTSFVVLDIPHQWTPAIHDILVGANEVVITANCDLPSLHMTKNYFEQLSAKRGVGSPIRLVINNHGASRKTELSPKDFEKAVSVKPSALIPSSPMLFGTSMNNGELIAQLDRKSEAAIQFDHLATVLSGRSPVTSRPSRFSVMRSKVM